MAKQNYIVKNGVAQPFPIPEAARPTFTEIRQVLRGYDEQGTLLPNAAIITDSESKVDILRCGTLYADTIDGVVIDVPEEKWTNTTPTNITVGGLLAGSTLTEFSAIDILERILYAFIPASISNFTLGNLPLDNDLGTNLSGQNATFSISLSNPSSSSGLNITYAGIATGNFANGLPNNTSSYNATIPNGFTSIIPGAQITVTLTAVQSNNNYASSISTKNIRWWSRVYYGKSTDTTLSTYTTLQYGGDYQVQTTGSNNRDVNLQFGSGYIYFFVHNSRKINSIFIGSQNATNSFVEQTQPVTVSGIPYKVYRSTEIINGQIICSVTTGVA